MIENWEKILTVVNTFFIVFIIIVQWNFLRKNLSKYKENNKQNDDEIKQLEIQINQEKQLIPEQYQQQIDKQEHIVIMDKDNQFQKNDEEIYQSNQNPQNREKELKDTQQLYEELKYKIESTQFEFNQFKQQYENGSKDYYQKLKNDNTSAAYEVNQLKQSYDQEIKPIILKFQEIQNETNEKQKTQKNEFTQLLNDLREKYDSEILAINQKLMEMPNQDQLKKMVKQIESLENCSKKLDENCTTTKLNLQSQQQDIQVTLEQFSKTRNSFEQYYNQANLPNHLKNLQELRKKLIKLIGIEDDENLIIIPFDPIRLQRTQTFVYKLYEETSSKRAVDLQYKYFVRETVNFNDMTKNYSIAVSSKNELKKHCTSYKPVRGDGNCFYTAFVFQFLEFAICSYNQTQFQQFIKHCLNINLPMRLKINKHEPESVDEQLQVELLKEFIYRLQEIRKIENIDERRKVFEKQFAAFEKQDEEIDGCFYALASIFIRNYTNYAVEFHDLKEALFDRANLLIWEEECESSTEVVMQSLQKKLNLDIKLIFIQKDNSILVNKYENNSKYKIILMLKPGHYGIGYFNPLPLPEKYNYFQAFLEQLNSETFKNTPELVTLNEVDFHIKETEYLDFQSQNFIKLGAVPLEQQSIY